MLPGKEYARREINRLCENTGGEQIKFSNHDVLLLIWRAWEQGFATARNSKTACETITGNRP